METQTTSISTAMQTKVIITVTSVNNLCVDSLGLIGSLEFIWGNNKNVLHMKNIKMHMIVVTADTLYLE